MWYAEQMLARESEWKKYAVLFIIQNCLSVNIIKCKLLNIAPCGRTMFIARYVYVQYYI